MRIGYVAKHDSGGNDDEGAITFALEKLGHSVQRLREQRGYVAYKFDCDFVLFHHWHDIESIAKIGVPKVFWNFDLVTYPDPTLRERNERRARWMQEVTGVSDLGFCTDGDWVNQDASGKLVWLLQGADERVVGPGQLKDDLPLPPPILFVGSYRGGGAGRESFVSEMQQHYSDDFGVVQRTHGRALADVIASTQIVVAPDHPATDRYWSNRVFNTLGFGGFLLHPRCKELETMYEDRQEIVFYDSRPELHELIEHYSRHPDVRRVIAKFGYEQTLQEHLYRHRVEQLVKTVQERLF